MEFVPGRQLNAAFYREIVAPAVGEVPHAAALLGWGSDVLGYDTARSTDHGWGPRLQVFVDASAVDDVGGRVLAAMPEEFQGWPVRYGWDEVMQSDHVEVTTLGGWLRGRLGFDPTAGVTTADWLTTPQQLLLEVVGGAVFHDGVGDLAAARDALAWYPDDVWLWLLACQWRRIEQEEAFVGRTAEAGDELGSRIVAARLARDLIRLCFLIERRYAPYSKWMGTAFAHLTCAADVGPALERALAAPDYPSREARLVDAYEAVARHFNALGVIDPLEPTVRLYYGRPFLVLYAERFTAACQAAITDADLRARPPIGAIDQFVDSTDILSHGDRAKEFLDIMEAFRT
jgi:hypothetical protein